jgi:hypothetical protein
MTEFSIYIAFDEIESYRNIVSIKPIPTDREKVIDSAMKI